MAPATPAAATLRPDPRPEPRTFDAGPHAAPVKRRGGASLILPVIVFVALAIIAVMLWSQRDGARSVAEREQTSVAPSEETGEAEVVEEGETSTPASKNASDDGDTIRTTAASLDSAFFSDPEGARARYNGAVTVTGTIATMVNPGGTPSLSLEGRTPLNFMVANFPESYRERLSSLSKGDRVTLSCSSVNGFAGTTILQGCALD